MAVRVLMISEWNPLPVVHVFRDREQALRTMMRGQHDVEGFSAEELETRVFELNDAWADPGANIWCYLPSTRLAEVDHTMEE